MSAKLSIPSYRNRYLTIQSMLQKYTSSPWHKVLNLGCGEGEYDPMIAQYARELIACDINPNDLAVAAERNRAVNNLTYQAEDALALTFANDTFDLLIAVEVIEHVGKPHRSTQKHPFAPGLTDLIIQVDRALFGKSSCSLGMTVVLQKAEKKF